MTDWEAIVQEHGRLVWRTVYRIVGNEADAADCLQQTFLSAIEFSRTTGVRHWPALLRKIATSVAINRLRQRQRERLRFTDLPEDAIACNGGDPVQAAESSELAARLRIALAELPPAQAEAFCLCKLEGCSYRETARAMGISTVSAGVLVHRAKLRLRELLKTGEFTLHE